jgi:dipeptidyl aminopeptidase/acylaminoacyl peptidase
VWFDRAGVQGATLGSAYYGDLKLSPDGTRVAVTVLEPGQNSRDIWILDIARGTKTRFTFDPADDRDPVWSPNSTQIVFTSNRKGPNNLYQEVYVAPTSGPSGVKWQISTGGGTSVEWRGDGRELYYRDDGGIVAVDVHAEGTRFEAGLPKRLISVILAGPRSTFAVTNDGQKFLAIRAREVSEAAPLTLVVNWRPQKR